LPQTPEGRALLQVEHFGAEQAATLVWVNPQHAGEPADEQRGAEESALDARWYTRQGAADWHVFGRWGEHTHASVGAALAFVATDELELRIPRGCGATMVNIDPQAADAVRQPMGPTAGPNVAMAARRQLMDSNNKACAGNTV
jgi:hypothetical protein